MLVSAVNYVGFSYIVTIMPLHYRCVTNFLSTTVNYYSDILNYRNNNMIHYVNSRRNVDSEKSEPQMGFEPTTLRDLVGCSNMTQKRTGPQIAFAGSC